MKNTELNEKFANFIEQQLTKKIMSASEIARELGIDEKNVEKLILQNNLPFKIFTVPDSYWQPAYRAIPKKILTPRQMRNGETRIWDSIPIKKLFPERNVVAPLHFVQIDYDGPKIKIYFLADFHYGGEGFDNKGFQKCINTVKEKDHALMVTVGDALELALASSVPGAVYGQQMRPHDQVISFREEIKPIAHKILFMQPGNHEARVIKTTDIDPLEFGVCDYYDIPYFNEPLIMIVSWKNNFFTFYFRHGKSCALTPGGKLNAAARPLSFLPHIQFIVMAHVHTPTSGINIRRCREYKYDDKGNLVDFSVVKKEEFIVICASTHRYFVSYSSREEYPPVVMSVVEACILNADGKYHLEKKPLVKPLL
jgi:hypothetical protein